MKGDITTYTGLTRSSLPVMLLKHKTHIHTYMSWDK